MPRSLNLRMVSRVLAILPFEGRPRLGCSFMLVCCVKLVWKNMFQSLDGVSLVLRSLEVVMFVVDSTFC